jgi:hypothetical protein
MNQAGTTVLQTVLIATLIATGVSQDAASKAQHEDLNLKVEITMQSHDFAPSDKIGFRAILINEGKKAVYIAKSWEYSGGGIAGFHANVKQLSGKPPNGGCSVAGDRGFFNESRPAAQILREDFVLLAPNAFVGFDGALPDCSPMSPGTYEITAKYSASDWNTPQVIPLGGDEEIVLTGTIRSGPIVFRIR